MLDTELQNQVNIILRDVGETSLRLVHNLIDILQDTLNIRVVNFHHFNEDDSIILTTSRGKRNAQHEID